MEGERKGVDYVTRGRMCDRALQWIVEAVPVAIWPTFSPVVAGALSGHGGATKRAENTVPPPPANGSEPPAER